MITMPNYGRQCREKDKDMQANQNPQNKQAEMNAGQKWVFRRVQTSNDACNGVDSQLR